MLKMTRRITRTLSQVAAFVLLVLILVFIADSRYRVLPDAVHVHLPTHHTGSVITDMDVAFCSSVNPLSSCRLEPEKWQRVEKDLYLHSGWLSSAWLHVQRKKEEELMAEDRVVVGVYVGRRSPGAGEEQDEWEKREGGLWVLRSSKRHDSDSEKAVTAVDVLFGADAVDPRHKWELSQTPLDVGGELPTRLTVRHGQPKIHSDKETTPRVGKDGRFKILQISDAHLSTGTGTCRDAIGPNNAPSTNCEADPRTLGFIETILDDEKPDLVVLSGDQVEGPAAPDTQTTLFKLVAPFIEREIPYAAIFGNHDDEGARSLSRSAQMSILSTLPFSLSQSGPESLAGVGNYYVEVLGHSSSDHSALTIYLLDSHGLTPDEKAFKGYDWLKENQISWFRDTARGLKRQHGKYSHIHMDMAFIHIPLPEYADQENLIRGGRGREHVTAPGYNSHFYDALAEEGVVALGCGHDHVNDYCALRPASAQHQREHEHERSHFGPWMCYAGGSGFGGYAGYGGFHRRVRLWEVDTNAGRLMSWKRVECCGEEVGRRVDEVVLAEGGHVVGGS